MPYERFVILLKSRSRTHHPHMHYSYTVVGAKTCFPSRFTQKCFTPTLGENTKNMLHRFPSNICSKFLLLSLQQLLCRKEAQGYTIVIHKKKKIKNRQVSKIFKTMGTQMPTWKNKINKIAHVFLQIFPSLKRERYVFKEYSRIRLATIYSTHMHILI